MKMKFCLAVLYLLSACLSGHGETFPVGDEASGTTGQMIPASGTTGEESASGSVYEEEQMPSGWMLGPMVGGEMFGVGKHFDKVSNDFFGFSGAVGETSDISSTASGLFRGALRSIMAEH